MTLSFPFTEIKCVYNIAITHITGSTNGGLNIYFQGSKMTVIK